MFLGGGYAFIGMALNPFGSMSYLYRYGHVYVVWVDLVIGWERIVLKGACTHEHHPRSELSGPNDLVGCVVVMTLGGS